MNDQIRKLQTEIARLEIRLTRSESLCNHLEIMIKLHGERLDIISKQFPERMDVMSERIGIVNKRIDRLLNEAT